MKILLSTTLLTLLFGLPVVGHTGHPKPDLRLSIAAPESTLVRVRRRHGIKSLRYVNRSGILATTQWPLALRIESRTALGFVAKRAKKKEREALVLTDPDECLNLYSLVDDLMLSAFDPGCIGLPEDETYVEIQTEKHDTFGVFDNDTTGNDAIRARLVDDRFSDPAPRNTPFLRMFNGSVKEVGPKTGGRPDPMPDPPNPKPDELDGYGYGADDDLAGLVVMVDGGGARVFDENFDLVAGVIRNMAGFINTVSAEDLDGRGQTTITAYLHSLAGAFEPIAIVDAALSDPALAGFDYAIRVDSGPLTGFNLEEPFPPDMPGAANAFYDELLSQYYPAEFRLRAVVVNGEAPDFVYDLDGNGRYSARDVKLAGYELLTNEVQINLTVTHENLLIDSPNPKCPPRTFIHGDLDGDMQRGKLPPCEGTSGSTRSRRIPR